jgi:hypothetical protein
MYSDSTSAWHYRLTKREEKQREEKGGKKQLLYKGRALFPPPLSIIQQDIRIASSCLSSARAKEEVHNSRNQKILTCCPSKIMPSSIRQKTMPPRPSNVHKLTQVIRFLAGRRFTSSEELPCPAVCWQAGGTSPVPQAVCESPQRTKER